ncbi:MAG: hydrogenase maturation nickel metallochaperone HypA [Lewinellaceae bacterium]|nr:hydrogenase maturation nickel metallochaperone HypA [Lewinellaceae bacterium]
MHELSIIQSILESTLAVVQDRSETCTVDSIDLQVGALAGVELSTLEFLWPAAVGDTPLADTKLQIEQLPGKAVCSDCGKSFNIGFYYDPCPDCGSHFLNITQGEELRIKSITLVSAPSPPPQGGGLPPNLNFDWNEGKPPLPGGRGGGLTAPQRLKNQMVKN